MKESSFCFLARDHVHCNYITSEPFKQADSEQIVLIRGYYCNQTTATVMEVMTMSIMVENK